MDLLKRFKDETPSFWIKVRNWAAVVTVLAGGIATLPISLPAGVVAVAGHIALVAGSVAGTSQMVRKGKEE